MATFTLIEAKTLSSNTATVSFTSIPATYTDLRVIVSGIQLSGANSCFFRYNNDSTASYSTTYLKSNVGAGSVDSGRDVSQTSTRINQGSGFPQTSQTNVVASFYMEIFRYTAALAKTTLLTFNNESSDVGKSVSLYQSGTAINRIDFITSGVDWAVGTTVTIYGIKAA